MRATRLYLIPESVTLGNVPIDVELGEQALPCVYRKLDSAILVMKATENRV